MQDLEKELERMHPPTPDVSAFRRNLRNRLLDGQPRVTYWRHFRAAACLAVANAVLLVAFVLFPGVPRGLHDLAFRPAAAGGDESPVIVPEPGAAPSEEPERRARAGGMAVPDENGMLREWARVYYGERPPRPLHVKKQFVSEYQFSNGDDVYVLWPMPQDARYQRVSH